MAMLITNIFSPDRSVLLSVVSQQLLHSNVFLPHTRTPSLSSNVIQPLFFTTKAPALSQVVTLSLCLSDTTDAIAT